MIGPFKWGSQDPEVRVFLSYKRCDLASVRALADALEARFGEEQVFFDLSDIQAGAKWEAKLHTEVLSSDVVVGAVSENWLTDIQSRDPDSDFVVREIGIALEHDIPVIPVLFPGVAQPSVDDLPSRIRGLTRHQSVELDHGRWQEDIASVADAISALAEKQGAGDDRARKINIARCVAHWFEIAFPDEKLLGRLAGTKEDDPVLLVTSERMLVYEGGGHRELLPADIFAVRTQGSDCWLLALGDEVRFKHLLKSDLEHTISVLEEVCPTADVAIGKPDDHLWRSRRIARAIREFAIDDADFTTGGMKQGDAVLLVSDNELTIVRRKSDVLARADLKLDEIGAVCRHKESLWVLAASGEYRIDHVPNEDLDRVVQLLAERAPRAPLYRKPPDRQVRQDIVVFHPHGLAEGAGIDLEWTKDLRPTPEEALVLSVAKLHVMERDLAIDPDWDDRIAKRKVIDTFIRALVSACAVETTDDARSAGSLEDLRKCIAGSEWADVFRATVAKFDPEDARRVLQDGDLLEALLGSIDRRDRALVLLVELAAFYPWASSVKFEKGSRESALGDVSDGFGASVNAEVFGDIDRKLKERTKELGGSGRNWARLAALAAAGTALGIATGGLATPLIGGAIGGAMGLSGAAATSAGLALLGGGSLAAGGAGMAGGAALIGVIGGVMGAGAGLLGERAISREQLLTESVKLDLLTETVLLGERYEGAHVASVVELLGAQVDELRSDLDRRRTERKGTTETVAEKMKDRLSIHKRDDLVEVEERLEILEGLKKSLGRQLERFIERTTSWVSGSEEAVELTKQSADPSVLLVIEAAETVFEAADRISRIVPALLVNADDEPIGSVIVDVMKGSVDLSGEDALRVRGIKSELAAELGGAAIDVLGHPLVWGTVAAGVVTGSVAQASSSGLAALANEAVQLLPVAAMTTWLEAAGIDFAQFAKAIVQLLERELRQVTGEAAIDVAEGIRAVLKISGSIEGIQGSLDADRDDHFAS